MIKNQKPAGLFSRVICFGFMNPVRRLPLYQFEDRGENSGSAVVGQWSNKKIPRESGVRRHLTDFQGVLCFRLSFGFATPLEVRANGTRCQCSTSEDYGTWFGNGGYLHGKRDGGSPPITNGTIYFRGTR